MRRVFALLAILLLPMTYGSRPDDSIANLAVASGSPTTVRVIVTGDMATDDSLDTKVSDLALSLAPDLIVTAGDNINNSLPDQGDSNLDDYASLFAPTWGRLPMVHPSPGNHDCHIPGDGCAGYRTYFGVPDYYSFDLPGWHVVMLSSIERSLVSLEAMNAQLAWLTNDLAGVPTTTSVLAAWHQPLYSTAKHLGARGMQKFWDILQAHGANTIVVNGHNHVYERYAPIGVITEFEISPGGSDPSCVFDATVVPQPVVEDGCAGHIGAFNLGSDGSWGATIWRIPPIGDPSVVETVGSVAVTSYPLTVTKAGTGSGTVVSTPASIDCGATCSAEFPPATPVTLTAAPDPGSFFSGWAGSCTGTGECAVTMDAARSVTAMFGATTPVYPVTIGANSFAPRKLTIDQGTTVRWLVAAASSRNVADTIGLFDSGTLSPGSTYQFAYAWAGTFSFQNTLDSPFVGTVKVPIAISPPSGGTTTPFTVTWASAPPPPGYVFEVRLKAPGAVKFVAWQQAVTSTAATFLPSTGAGRYEFKCRLLSLTGVASAYSLVASITVA